MNFKKGLFRLTLVLSISVGIISSFVMIEREPYTKYKVKRTGEGIKELTVTFLWHGERNPDIFDFLEVFQEAEKTNKKVIEADEWDKYKVPKDQDKGKEIDPLVSLREKIRKQTEKEGELKELGQHFSIIEKTEKPIKWDSFFSVMGIGFASVWLVYGFMRWVVISFIVGGFKHKT